MKTLQRVMKWTAGMVIAGALSAGAQTTGWNQTGAGPYDYNDTANWVGGTVNGIWDSSLTLLAAPTVTFGPSSTV